MRDEKYAEFQRKLLPSLPPEQIIGVRTPELKKLAKGSVKDVRASDFISKLPHEYFDENQLHAFIISETKDPETCIRQVEAFLPYVDNWATCDQLSPKAFSKNPVDILPLVYKWMRSDHTYTVRFGIGMLMRYFLDDLFTEEHPKAVAAVHSDEYYVNMMIAWYFATALAKQYEAVLPFFERNELDKWTHNKAIQKAKESYRITEKQKIYLTSLKRK